MDLAIRATNEGDMADIKAIYQRARTFMAENGNARQWGGSWPPDSLVREDIAAGRSFVCEAQSDVPEVVAVFVCVPGPDSTYQHIYEGAWLSDTPYGVVHRIATSGTVRGVGKFCLDWAYKQYGHLRIDTHGDNIPMQGLLKKCGFTHCGTIYVEEDNDPRLAYERI